LPQPLAWQRKEQSMAKEHALTSRVEMLEQQMENLMPLVSKMATGMEQQAKRFNRMENSMTQLSESVLKIAQDMKEQKEWSLGMKEAMLLWMTQWTTGHSKPKGDGEPEGEVES
jgi:hypothetical protein